MEHFLTTKDIFHLSCVYTVFNRSISSLMIHKSNILIQVIHLFIEKHCSTDKVMLILGTNNLQKIIGTDQTLRKDHNVVIHEENVCRLLLMVHCLQHTSCKTTSPAYIQIGMYHYMFCFQLFYRKCASIIHYMNPKILRQAIVTCKYGILQKLNIRKDIILFLKCSSAKMKRYMTYLFLIDFCIILSTINHTYSMCMDLKTSKHQIIFRIFQTNLLRLCGRNFCSVQNFSDILRIFFLIACKDNLHFTFYTQFQY